MDHETGTLDSMWRQRVRVLLDELRLDEDGIAEALREGESLAARRSGRGPEHGR